MAITKNAGRQEALTGYVDVDYTELTTAGKFEIMNLPYGATIVGGSITNGLTGPTDIALSVEDEDGTELQSDMAGTFGAYADILPDGTVLAVPGYVKMTTTGNASAGSVRVALTYIVDGRACVSEG